MNLLLARNPGQQRSTTTPNRRTQRIARKPLLMLFVFRSSVKADVVKTISHLRRSWSVPKAQICPRCWWLVPNPYRTRNVDNPGSSSTAEPHAYSTIWNTEVWYSISTTDGDQAVTVSNTTIIWSSMRQNFPPAIKSFYLSGTFRNVGHII